MAMKKMHMLLCQNIVRTSRETIPTASSCLNVLLKRMEIDSITHLSAMMHRQLGLDIVKNYIVKLEYMTCTCFQWQSTGIPCSHGINIILQRRENPQTYVQVFLFLDAYHNTYAHAIFPPNADTADKPLQYSGDYSSAHSGDHSGEIDGGHINGHGNRNENIARERVIAPHVCRPPGRPQTRRIRSGVEGPYGGKRSKTCGRCGNLGHAQNTCKGAISGV